MEAYFEGTWFPCHIIRRKEELPNSKFHLWKQKEESCKEFGEDSHVVVLWFEDDPPSYSVLPSDNTRPSDKPNQTRDTLDESHGEKIAVSMDGTIATVGSVIEIIPSEYFRSALITCVDFTKASNLKRIAENSFISCNSLKDVVFPKSLEVVGKYAFSGCTKLLLLIMNEGLNTIENGAFRECYSMENLCLPSTMEKILPEAFYGCTGLVTAALNETLKIGGDAFKKCRNLKKIGVLPNATFTKSSFPKSAKRFPPEVVFDEIFPLIKNQAEKLGIELPSHAPRRSAEKPAKEVQAVPDSDAFNQFIQVLKTGFTQYTRQSQSAVAGNEDMEAELREQRRKVAQLSEDRNKLADKLEEVKQKYEATKRDFAESQQYLEQAKLHIAKTEKDTKEKWDEFVAERNGLMYQIDEERKTIAYNRMCRGKLAGELHRATKDMDILAARNRLITKRAEIESVKWLHEKRKIQSHSLQTMTELEKTKKTLEETRSALEAAKAASREAKTMLDRTQAKLLDAETERDALQSKVDSTAESQESVGAVWAWPMTKRKVDSVESPSEPARKSSKIDKQIVRDL